MTRIEGLAERIAERMQALGYWKRDRPDVRRFCEARGYTPQYVYGWLRGRMPTLPYLNRLADDFGVTVEWLALGGGVAERAGPPRRDRIGGGAPEPAREAERGRAERGKVIEHPLARVGVLVERLARSEAELQSTVSAWRDSEARFRKIFEDGPLGMAIVDPQSLHFLGVNPRLSEMLGFPAEEIVGRHALHFTHPEEAAAAADALARVQSGELPFASRETRYLRRPAGVIWGHVTSMIVRNEAGAPLYLVEMVQDVTERKSAEERLQSLFAGIPVGLYRSTPEGEICDANPALLQIFGCEDLETLRGLDASDLYVDPDERKRWEEALRRNDVVRDYEKRVRRRDGTVIWVGDSARAVRDGEGRLVAWEGALEDITARKRAEEATTALARVGRELVGTLDLARTTERIAKAAFDLLRVRRSALYQLDRAGGRFICMAAAGVGDPREWIGRCMPADRGLMSLAAREGAPVWSADVLADPRFLLPEWCRDRAEVQEYRSGLAVPLRAGGEVLGVLGIGDAFGREYSTEEVGLLSALADQAALAFANARLYEEAERRRREAEVLADLAGQITASLELGTVMKAVIAGAKALCRSDLASIALADTATGAMVFRYWDDPRFERYAGCRIQPGKGSGGRTLVNGRPFRTDDYVEDPRISKDYVAVARAEGIVAEMVVPIRIDGRIEGLLYVHHRSPREFSDRDEVILVRLADHAAIAIRNARLFEEAERRRMAAESLADVSRLVSESLDPREVGQRIVESVLGLLAVETAGLYELDAISGRLQALAVAGDVGPVADWNVVLAPGTGVVGLAVRERHAVFTANCFADPRVVYTPEVRARLQAIPYPTVLAVPLVVKGTVVGALGLGDRAGRRFEPEEVRLAEAFANQAAVALENARLFAQTEAHRDRLLGRAADPAGPAASP
jgi:PAS domain S-box-containing protein